MLKLNCILVLLAISFPASSALGNKDSSVSLEATRKCAEQIQERMLAITMRDWILLDTIGRRFIQACSGAYDRPDIAKAYGVVAAANNEMGHYKEALDQAEAGIEADYLEASSHLEKVKALFALSSTSEAIEAFAVADYVIHLAIRLNDAQIAAAKTDGERELYVEETNAHGIECMILEEYRLLLGLK